jgi:hypothetical protein
MEKCNSTPISYLIAMNNSAIAESRARDFLRQTRSHLRDFQLRAEIEMTMEALKCNTTRKRLLMRFLGAAVERCGSFCAAVRSPVSVLVIKMIADVLDDLFAIASRTLFYAPQNREAVSRTRSTDSRVADFSSLLIIPHKMDNERGQQNNFSNENARGEAAQWHKTANEGKKTR